jgi:hypothetical protein
MAPIYDTDLADERFAKDEWNRFELWEKIEIRLRRRKRLWIGATAVAFVALSSVPIVMDRTPKWQALSATRRLAEEINGIKREANAAHAAIRIRFAGGGSLSYVVEKLPSCSAAAGPAVALRSGALLEPEKARGLRLLDRAKGTELGIGGFAESICYDYLAGSDVTLRGEPFAGFGIMPVNDLAEKRVDRLAILLATGPSADISFE